jgi:hypothetical protein
VEDKGLIISAEVKSTSWRSKVYSINKGSYYFLEKKSYNKVGYCLLEGLEMSRAESNSHEFDSTR